MKVNTQAFEMMTRWSQRRRVRSIRKVGKCPGNRNERELIAGMEDWSPPTSVIALTQYGTPDDGHWISIRTTRSSYSCKELFILPIVKIILETNGKMQEVTVLVSDIYWLFIGIVTPIQRLRPVEHLSLNDHEISSTKRVFICPLVISSTL